MRHREDELARILSLHLYPVKSCRAVNRTAVTLGSRGLRHDREWMVVDAAGRFVSLRTQPALARVIATVSDGVLSLSADGHGRIDVACAPARATTPVSIWRDHCEAGDQGDAAAAWLSAIVGAPVRLMHVEIATRRDADPVYAGLEPVPVAFQDGFPLLVCNRASLEDLNARMVVPVPMTRFRPNVVLDGLEPWAEDCIAALEIGSVRLRFVKPCTRCIITATDPVTGVRGGDPLPVLREFRFDRELRGVTFGMNAIVERSGDGRLETGTGVRVIAARRLQWRGRNHRNSQ